MFASKTKKKLKRVDWDIAVRLLTVLFESGKTKKTTIARNSKMSYDNCLLYLDWLELFGLAKKETDYQGFEIFSLTALGTTIYKTKIARDQELNLEHFPA